MTYLGLGNEAAHVAISPPSSGKLIPDMLGEILALFLPTWLRLTTLALLQFDCERYVFEKIASGSPQESKNDTALRRPPFS